VLGSALLLLAGCRASTGAASSTTEGTPASVASSHGSTLAPALLALRDAQYSEEARTEFAGSDVRPSEVYGVVVEIAGEGTVVVVAAFKDGTSHLIAGKGGNVVAKKEQLPPDTRLLARELVTAAQQLPSQLSPEKERPLPGPNNVRISVLTGSEIYADERTSKSVDDVRSDLSTFWATTNHLMHALLSYQQQSNAR